MESHNPTHFTVTFFGIWRQSSKHIMLQKSGWNLGHLPFDPDMERLPVLWAGLPWLFLQNVQKEFHFMTFIIQY